MKIFTNEVYSYERAFYNMSDVKLDKCRFEGEEDGESAIKECSNFELNECLMDLRYPLWHGYKVKLNDVTMTPNCRAALWYSDNITITNSNLLGIKALRECSHIFMDNVKINSMEFGWNSKIIRGANLDINGEYLFFNANEINLDKINFKGKYSFQYTNNVIITNSLLDTKDAFWHAKNVIVRDSIIKGEYLAWYSDGLTLINCKIIGTQPLCYCKNLKLINCTMENTDLSFEYSDVDANVIGSIMSVKNPKSGVIIADKIDEIIITDDSKYECLCEIKIN